MESFATIFNNQKPLTIATKLCILNLCGGGSGNAFAVLKHDKMENGQK